MTPVDEPGGQHVQGRRPRIVRGVPLLAYAVLLVGLVAASFSDRLTVSGEPPVGAPRATLSWVAVGSAAYLFLLWPIFLFATRRAAARPWWQVAAEGAGLLVLSVPALLAAVAFSNAPAPRVWLVGGYLGGLVVLMVGLSRLSGRLPATGRWVLTAVEVLGLGVPLLVYFFKDFSEVGTDWSAISPPLAAAAVAEGSLSPAQPLALLAICGFAAAGLAAWGVSLLIGASAPSAGRTRPG
jgi:hypothetical protein